MKFILHRQVVRVLILLALDILLFTATNATTAPSFVAIVGFLLLVTTVYYIIHGLAGIGRIYGLPMRHRKSLAVYLTIVTGLIIALQSIGELGSHDILVILPLALVGYLYSVYAKAGGRNLEG